jgi:hypothetical protein
MLRTAFALAAIGAPGCTCAVVGNIGGGESDAWTVPDAHGNGDLFGVDGGGAAGVCAPNVCGAAAAPAPSAGLASFSPPGCDGGGFSLAWTYELVSDGAKAVPQLADLDGDGLVDLIVNPRKLPSAIVFRGDGTGQFDAGAYLPAGGIFAGGWGIDLGDVDGDGRLDLAAGDHVAGALAWRNGPAMAFALSAGGLPAGTFNGVGLADLSGDGRLDALFGADQFDNGFELRLGDGAGGWTAAAPAGLPAYNAGGGPVNSGHFAFADYDADGDLDVFAFGQRSGGISAFVYRNDGGAAAFSAVAELAGGTGNLIGNPVEGGVGDVNCDGALDVAAGGSIWLGAPGGAAGTWTLGATVDDASISHLGDADGDGLLDLFTHGTAGLRLWINGGDGTTWTLRDAGLPDETHVPAGLGGGDAVYPLGDAYGIDLADLNGDDRLDVVRVLRSGRIVGFSTFDQCFVEVWLRD